MNRKSIPLTPSNLKIAIKALKDLPEPKNKINVIAFKDKKEMKKLCRPCGEITK